MGKVTFIAISILFYLLGYFVSKFGNDINYTLKMCKYLDEKIEEHDFPDDSYGISEKIGYLKAKSDISYFCDKKENNK